LLLQDSQSSRVDLSSPLRCWKTNAQRVATMGQFILPISDAAVLVGRPRPQYPPKQNGFAKPSNFRDFAAVIYGAHDVVLPKAVTEQLAHFEAMGFGALPICMAKTQYSFSADPELRGAPEGFLLSVREVRLSAGAGFVVAVCGDTMTMPGLPKRPSGERIRLDARGRITGLS